LNTFKEGVGFIAQYESPQELINDFLLAKERVPVEDSEQAAKACVMDYLEAFFQNSTKALLEDGQLLFCDPRKLSLGTEVHTVWALKGLPRHTILCHEDGGYRWVSSGVPVRELQRSGAQMLESQVSANPLGWDENFSMHNVERITLI
jgi:hypothetical protein